MREEYIRRSVSGFFISAVFCACAYAGLSFERTLTDDVILAITADDVAASMEFFDITDPTCSHIANLTP